MTAEPFEIKVSDWTVKVRQPEQVAGEPEVILMLHGWTGNENSMWVFASRLPKHALLVAPRAPFEVVSKRYSGHSWIASLDGSRAGKDAYGEAVIALDSLLSGLSHRLDGDFSKIGLVGFSQGAAMSYAYALLHPHKTAKLAALAGFVPDGFEPMASQRPLKKLKVLVAHGIRDEIVPQEQAQQAVELMRLAGADVDLCLSDVGHKLGSDCFKALQSFFE